MPEEAPQRASSEIWFAEQFDISVHYFRYVHDMFRYHPPHVHGEYSLTLCLDSEMEYEVAGTCERLERGDLLIINPGETHRGRYALGRKPSVGMTMSIAPAALRDVLRAIGLPADYKGNPFWWSRRVRLPSLIALAGEMLAESEERRHGYKLVISSLLQQFLVYLFRHGVEPVTCGTRAELPRQLPAWQMVRTLEYMDTHTKESFSLDGLYSEVGIGQSNFFRLFSNSCGMTPHAYYNCFLIRKATALLRESDLSIKEITYCMGFRNESHFCKLFHAISGVAPRQFRLSSTRADSAP